MRIFASFMASLWSVVAFWLGGFDFNHRGTEEFFCFLFSTILFFLIYSYPGWNDRKK